MITIIKNGIISVQVLSCQTIFKPLIRVLLCRLRLNFEAQIRATSRVSIEGLNFDIKQTLG